MNQHSKTAILIFANSSREEGLRKSISGGADLFYLLNKQVLSLVKRSGLSYVLFSEEQQSGDSFGERFVNALDAVYKQGFESVIAIGNDTPQLSLSHLKEAANKVSSSKMVLGPSTDGGIYLLALHKNSFDTTKFLELPWQTNVLCKSLLDIVNVAETINLEVLQDIDDASDLNKILSLQTGISKILRSTISKIIARVQTLFRIPSVIQHHRYLTTNFNKGSPILLMATIR